MTSIKGKVYKITFHGTTLFYGEDKKDAVNNFLAGAYSAREDFVISKVIEIKDTL
jgi:hypothetical protein